MATAPQGSEWLLTPADLSDALGVSPRHVLRETQAGRLPCAVQTTLRNGKVRHRYTLQNLVDYVQTYCSGDTAAVIARAQGKLAA